MDINLLKQLLINQKENFLKEKDLIKRDIGYTYDDLISLNHVIAVMGVRRAGKSSFLKIIASYLLKEKGLSPDSIFYVNFEDEFFTNFQVEDFSLLLSAFHEVNKIQGSKIYCFFDEIQNVKFWEKWVRKLYDTDNFKIFITGSNSSLLKSEYAEALTGRNYPIDIYPFSFSEYLRFNRIELPSANLTTEEKSSYKSQFNKYLVVGGFPEAIRTDLSILEELYQNIIYKDILSRYGVRNIKEFREAAYYLLSNICSPMSYRGIVKSAGSLESPTTAKNYVGYLEDSYLIFTVKKLEASIKKQLANPFKIYGIDNGLIKEVAFSISDNFNKYYENLAFLHLKRRQKTDIFYFKGKYEADFVVKENREIKDIVQVCYNIDNEKTKQREERGLLEALTALDKAEGYIINDYIEKEEIIDKKKIIYLPMWKWLLGE